MFDDPQGPITHFDWGRFQIQGKIHSADGEGAGKDIFLVGEEVCPWDARHGHRLTPEMVACVLGRDIRILVIGNGVNGALKVPRKVRKAIKSAGIEELMIAKTPEACEIFNRLYREGERVALLAHGTC